LSICRIKNLVECCGVLHRTTDSVVVTSK